MTVFSETFWTVIRNNVSSAKTINTGKKENKNHEGIKRL